MRRLSLLALLCLFTLPAHAQDAPALADLLTAETPDAAAITAAVIAEVGAALAGGAPADTIAAALDALSAGTPIAFQVQPFDFNGDGALDSLVRPYARDDAPRSFPAIAVASTGAGFTLPPTLPDPGVYGWAAAALINYPPLLTVTVDGQPPSEILLHYAVSGASSVTVNPVIYQWNGEAFEVLFSAALGDWAGRSSIRYTSTQEGDSAIVMMYPHLAANPLEEKLALHPMATQAWVYDAGLNAYVFDSETVDYTLTSDGTSSTSVQQQRWRFLDAETRLRQGDFLGAVARFDEVAALGIVDLNGVPLLTEGEPDWTTMANFRAGMATLLATGTVTRGQEREAFSRIMAIVNNQRETWLGELAHNFRLGYADGAFRDSAARGLLAMSRADANAFADAVEPFASNWSPLQAGVLSYLNANRYESTSEDTILAGLQAAGYFVLGVDVGRQTVSVELSDGTVMEAEPVGEHWELVAPEPLPTAWAWPIVGAPVG